MKLLDEWGSTTNLEDLVELGTELPTRIRRRDLRTDKFEKERDMGRPHTECKREKPMGSNGTKAEKKGPSMGSEKQYFQTGKKYAGPNYAQASVTGPLQNGGRGGKGAK